MILSHFSLLHEIIAEAPVEGVLCGRNQLGYMATGYKMVFTFGSELSCLGKHEFWV